MFYSSEFVNTNYSNPYVGFSPVKHAQFFVVVQTSKALLNDIDCTQECLSFHPPSPPSGAFPYQLIYFTLSNTNAIIILTPTADTSVA